MNNGQNVNSIRLRNVSGIPVVEIVGILNQTTIQSLDKTISYLVSAGHYNIVVNVKKTIAPNLSCLESLAECVKKVQQHYGVIQLVVEAGQIAQASVGEKLAKLFRFSISEGQAFQRIKGLMRPDESAAGASAYLWEKK